MTTIHQRIIVGLTKDELFEAMKARRTLFVPTVGENFQVRILRLEQEDGSGRNYNVGGYCKISRPELGQYPDMGEQPYHLLESREMSVKLFVRCWEPNDASQNYGVLMLKIDEVKKTG